MKDKLKLSNWLDDESQATPGPPPHCYRCGRFVSPSSLLGGHMTMDGEYTEVTGACKIHGRVDVVWERS